jgi:hypothetical protein
MKTTLATVLCGICAAEHRNRPGRLGTVEQWQSEPMWLVWRPINRWLGKSARHHFGITPQDTAPLVPLWVPGTADRVLADCRYHGRGSVATSDVLAARGTIVVNFRATG